MSCVGGQFIISASMHLNEEINSNKAVTNTQNGDVKMHFIYGEKVVLIQKDKANTSLGLCIHLLYIQYNNANACVY